jgi:starch phosphorylase
MALLTPRFSADRTVREYTEQRYLPAAAAFRERAANKGVVGRQIVDWQHAIEQGWGLLRFGEVRVDTSAEHHVFEVDLFLNDLALNAVRVELYAEGTNGGEPVRQTMTYVRPAPDTEHVRVYQATVPATRPAGDYTARVVPQHPGVAVPLESNRILWQRR